MDTPTLGKFFTLHFLLPFVIAILALIHILFLHDSGSSSQLQTICLQDQKYPFSYCTVNKDLLGMLYLVLFGYGTERTIKRTAFSFKPLFCCCFYFIGLTSR